MGALLCLFVCLLICLSQYQDIERDAKLWIVKANFKLDR